MIYIDRHEEPAFWKEFCVNNPTVCYDDLQGTEEGRKVRNKIRKFNLEQQHGLCAYCCKAIDVDSSINEHIKPRGISAYANLSMAYSNIVTSCRTEGAYETCSASKKNSYDARFISPLDQACESYFEYYPTGEIVSKSESGKYTIDVLNLNSYKLRNARRAMLKCCMDYVNLKSVRDYFLQPDENDKLQPYQDIIRYFVKNGWFDG